ncbi:Arm DNA-binding domain-containing protein, partial [uncultured Pedobacter sp.]|uniref:Arm DNA-binding domain-containing protein n=2 Tax=Pedobacter TaxID=84567 RepID=UPI002638CAA5
MKSNQTLKILFWHRKSKANLKDYAPIIFRISIDGKDAEFSTGQKVHIDNWDIELKKVVRSENSKKINAELNRITSALEINFTVLKTQHEFISPSKLKNSYRNISIASNEQINHYGLKIHSFTKRMKF